MALTAEAVANSFRLRACFKHYSAAIAADRKDWCSCGKPYRTPVFDVAKEYERTIFQEGTLPTLP